jgi:hypothetical protein
LGLKRRPLCFLFRAFLRPWPSQRLIRRGVAWRTSLLRVRAQHVWLVRHDDLHATHSRVPRPLLFRAGNDAYSAVVVAQQLAKALNTDVNSLPLSIVLSWLEQKAVAVLLSLLYLNVKNVRIGPNLPAFVTPTTLAFLNKTFGLQHINEGAADGDVASVMGLKA